MFILYYVSVFYSVTSSITSAATSSTTSPSSEISASISSETNPSIPPFKGKAFNSSTVDGFLSKANSTKVFPNATKSAFLATKSVSELNSKITPTFPCSPPNTNPSAATLPDFFSCFSYTFFS